jgi:hypothetical protein
MAVSPRPHDGCVTDTVATVRYVQGDTPGPAILDPRRAAFGLAGGNGNR